jgi:hypothetical protein
MTTMRRMQVYGREWLLTVYRGLRLFVLVAGMLAVGAARAQPPQLAAEPPPPDHPAIETAALERLKATSRRLASAKTMSFTAVVTYESPARNGQPLYYSTLSKVEMRRPNKLRVSTPGDGPASDFYYDGKTMIAFAPALELAAVANAPPTLEEAMKAAYEMAAVYFPFEEVLVADPYSNLSDGLTSAFFVGQSHVIGGVVTDMLAIANDNVAAEIWIGISDGLPRMIRTSYKKDPMRSRYEIQFSDWRLNQPIADSDFTSARALKARRMDFARPDAPFPGKP